MEVIAQIIVSVVFINSIYNGRQVHGSAIRKPPFSSMECPFGPDSANLLQNYNELLDKSKGLVLELKTIKRIEWFPFIAPYFDMEVKIPMIQPSSSLFMIHRAVQEHIAIAYKVLSSVSENSLAEHNLVPAFTKLIKKSQALLCALEGIHDDINKTKYIYFTKHEIEAKIQPLAAMIDEKGLMIVATQIVDQQLQFATVVRSIVQKKLKIIKKPKVSKRHRKLKCGCGQLTEF